ncbi:crotonase/enoyl-CoA hydratase family protein [Paracidovorax wautersii]|nr:crotonase/enoyl-CoA hydratase family protein [Paracidovorax wautersii]
MTLPDFLPAQGLLAHLTELQVSAAGAVAHIRLNRPAKRNAINEALMQQLHTALIHLPASAGALVISGEGPHFCAGLDLSDLSDRSVAEGIHHSRGWHAVMDALQYFRVPVVVALQGAVVGGGLELAAAAHIRVADASTYFGLPEGQRGIFVGGGGSARIPRLAGVACMTDMMLTGRVLDASEGERRGLVQYVVPEGGSLAKAVALAQRIATNAPLSNYAVVQALPRIADMAQSDGLFVESLMAAIAQGDEAAKQRLADFLQGRAAKVLKT